MIDQGPKSGLNEEHLLIIIYNSLCALKFLHSSNVIHRDIKPANILVNQDCQVLICDFGLARTLPESCIGKGSGNTKRVRDSIHKQNLDEDQNADQIKKIIAKKLKN